MHIAPKCLDCGAALYTSHEMLGGICHQCLHGSSLDDLFMWPDGTVASREDIQRGDYARMSDDYRLMTEAEVDAYVAASLASSVP